MFCRCKGVTLEFGWRCKCTSRRSEHLNWEFNSRNKWNCIEQRFVFYSSILLWNKRSLVSSGAVDRASSISRSTSRFHCPTSRRDALKNRAKSFLILWLTRFFTILWPGFPQPAIKRRLARLIPRHEDDFPSTYIVGCIEKRERKNRERLQSVQSPEPPLSLVPRLSVSLCTLP